MSKTIWELAGEKRSVTETINHDTAEDRACKYDDMLEEYEDAASAFSKFLSVLGLVPVVGVAASVVGVMVSLSCDKVDEFKEFYFDIMKNLRGTNSKAEVKFEYEFVVRRESGYDVPKGYWELQDYSVKY